MLFLCRRENIEKIEESGSPGWGVYVFQTKEDVTRVFVAAVVAVRSPRPSVVYSSKDDSGSQLQKFQRQVTRLMKGLSSPPEVKSGPYNPEILTSQKRQWARFQLQSLVCYMPNPGAFCCMLKCRKFNYPFKAPLKI